MGLKRLLVEWCVSFYGFGWGYWPNKRPVPKKIFVLRNNDIGDLLVATPLLEALKRYFPEAQLVVGVGYWNRDVLMHNPYVDKVLTIDGPWHNKCVGKGWNTLSGFFRSIRYIMRSSQVDILKDLQCDIGIDVVGSPEGALLMLRAGILYRIGVFGYAGGHSGCQECIVFDETMHVGHSILQFAAILGATDLPEARPQIYLANDEVKYAKSYWESCEKKGRSQRIMIAPGGGFVEKCWPVEYYKRLVRLLKERMGEVTIVVVGSEQDKSLAKSICEELSYAIDATGQHTLRETFALASETDWIFCNSSMMMHAGAAFSKNTVVLLGHAIEDAASHKALWATPAKNLWVLGKTPHNPTLPNPENVIQAILG